MVIPCGQKGGAHDTHRDRFGRGGIDDGQRKCRRVGSESGGLYAAGERQMDRQRARRQCAAVIAGDPSKPGLYVVLTKWLAGNHFSRPHFHPNDRFITVIKGTWWVGSGPNFDPADATVPLPAGSVVTHYGKQVHYDGASDEDAVLGLVGRGP